MKTFKNIFLIGVLAVLFSCGEQIESLKKADNTNIEIPDTIISIYYGNDTGEVQLFNDGDIKCSISQVIDGSSSESNIFLYFTPQSNNETEIINVFGQMKWFQNEKIVPSTFILSSINVQIFNNDNQIDESSFLVDSLITEKFRKISGKNNQLLYNVKFSDSEYKSIPSNVEKVIIDLKIDFATKGKIKHYNQSVDLASEIHKILIPFGQRND